MAVFALAAVLIALGLLLPLFLRAHEKQVSISNELKAIALARLNSKFGVFTVLNSNFEWGVNKYEGLGISLEVLFKDSNGGYWRTQQSVFVKDQIFDESFTSLTELRARRALFNKPKEYLAAFGESPDRKQLARLMANEAKIES